MLIQRRWLIGFNVAMHLYAPATTQSRAADNLAYLMFFQHVLQSQHTQKSGAKHRLRCALQSATNLHVVVSILNFKRKRLAQHL